MCGILGVLTPSSGDRSAFQAALDSLKHRGPDGEGRFEDTDVLLGHRRLSIIDLSTCGAQPMNDNDTDVTIVFNGEIYNYIEVRNELEALKVKFFGRSDTEVLLRAYLQWGAEMLPRLNGMWAFAIWDPRTASLFMSRDRFGVKPLYYSNLGGTFVFASEPKALFRLRPELASPDAGVIADFFATSEMHAAADTFYSGIKALPPASYAVVRPGLTQVEPQIYWDYPDPSSDRPSAFDFGSMIEDAVTLRLRSDVPVGLTLSGGLDSSAILAAAGTSTRRLKCFTSVFGTNRGEEHWAKTAAAIAEAPLICVDSSVHDWQATLEKAVHHLDSPSYSPAIIPLWAIMASAKAQGVSVLLEGQGADELLGGYSRYFPSMLSQMTRSSLARTGTDLSRLSSTFGWKWMLLWSLRQALPKPYQAWARLNGGAGLLRQEVTDVLGPTKRPSDESDLFRVLQADHSRGILPALLHYGDAISMAHGVESRLPFMDYRLVEQVFRARPPLMVNGMTKAPIRNYLDTRGYGAIASRMDKKGYPTPVRDWLAGVGGDFINDTLADHNHAVWEFLQPAKVQRLVDAAAAGKETAIYQLFKVATAAIWLTNTRTARAN